MDNDLIRAKEDSIARCIARVQTKSHLTYEAFLEDYDAQDVVSLNLERAVQLAVDIAAHIISGTDRPVPDTMRGSFRALGSLGILPVSLVDRMQCAVGFRNTVVHTYQQVDWAIVYAIIHKHLSDFSDYVAAIEAHLT